jgi:hypothetical protein
MSQFQVGDVIKTTNPDPNGSLYGKFLTIQSVEPFIDEEDVQQPIIGYDYTVLVEPSNRKNRKGEQIDDIQFIKMLNGRDQPYEKDEQRGGKYRKSRRNRKTRNSKKSRRNRKTKRSRKY